MFKGAFSDGKKTKLNPKILNQKGERMKQHIPPIARQNLANHQSWGRKVNNQEEDLINESRRSHEKDISMGFFYPLKLNRPQSSGK